MIHARLVPVEPGMQSGYAGHHSSLCLKLCCLQLCVFGPSDTKSPARCIHDSIHLDNVHFSQSCGAFIQSLGCCKLRN